MIFFICSHFIKILLLHQLLLFFTFFIKPHIYTNLKMCLQWTILHNFFHILLNILFFFSKFFKFFLIKIILANLQFVDTNRIFRDYSRFIEIFVVSIKYNTFWHVLEKKVLQLVYNFFYNFWIFHYFITMHYNFFYI